MDVIDNPHCAAPCTAFFHRNMLENLWAEDVGRHVCAQSLSAAHGAAARGAREGVLSGVGAGEGVERARPTALDQVLGAPVTPVSRRRGNATQRKLFKTAVF